MAPRPVKAGYSCRKERWLLAALWKSSPGCFSHALPQLCGEVGGWGQGLGSLSSAFTTPVSLHSLRPCAGGTDPRGNVHPPQSGSTLSVNALKRFPLPEGWMLKGSAWAIQPSPVFSLAVGSPYFSPCAGLGFLFPEGWWVTSHAQCVHFPGEGEGSNGVTLLTIHSIWFWVRGKILRTPTCLVLQLFWYIVPHNKDCNGGSSYSDLHFRSVLAEA